MRLIKRIQKIEAVLGIDPMADIEDLDDVFDRMGVHSSRLESKVITEYASKGLEVSKRFVTRLHNTNVGYTIVGTEWVDIHWDKLLELRTRYTFGGDRAV